MRSVKSRVWFRVLVSLLLLGTVSTVSAEDKVGVVFLHGKGMPAQYKRLLGFLEGKGFLVSAPEMPWSKSREYDKPYNEGLNEIDAAVATLRAQGAKYVLIGGHSMGGNAALYYGTERKVDGLFLLAPAHIPQSDLFRNAFAASVARAKAQAASGKGAERASFDDMELSGGGAYTVETSAVAYLSYFDPEGSANMERTVTKLAPDIPLFMAVSSKENPNIRAIEDRIYPAIPGDKKKLVEVGAPHRGVPVATQEQLADWLETFKSL